MKFTIPKGQPFYCEFTIKEPGSAAPMDVTGATGTFQLSTIGPNATLALGPVEMTVVDGQNGIMSVSLTEAQTTDLVGRKGFAEDGYPFIATYRGALDITANEPIFVDIPKVYVSDSGS